MSDTKPLLDPFAISWGAAVSIISNAIGMEQEKVVEMLAERYELVPPADVEARPFRAFRVGEIIHEVTDGKPAAYPWAL